MIFSYVRFNILRMCTKLIIPRFKANFESCWLYLYFHIIIYLLYFIFHFLFFVFSRFFMILSSSPITNPLLFWHNSHIFLFTNIFNLVLNICFHISLFIFFFFMTKLLFIFLFLGNIIIVYG